MTHGWDRTADLPREQSLCGECWDYEYGRMTLDALRQAGVDTTDMVQTESESDVSAVGHEVRALWYNASDELLAELERAEPVEEVRAFADYLRELGTSLDQPPSPAVIAFLERHPSRSD